jgi:hypothetical protein
VSLPDWLMSTLGVLTTVTTFVRAASVAASWLEL